MRKQINTEKCVQLLKVRAGHKITMVPFSMMDMLNTLNINRSWYSTLLYEDNYFKMTGFYCLKLTLKQQTKTQRT